MNESNRKPSLDYIYARLDQVKMSEHERLLAKASLERAEAVSQLLLDATRALQRLLRTLVVRPIRRLTSQLG